ncbi:hypothetical protein HDE_10905 [Halotydeus destructor]|nr:hypothetical protein HDE_10905 [Halotydeus destructor]
MPNFKENDLGLKLKPLIPQGQCPGFFQPYESPFLITKAFEDGLNYIITNCANPEDSRVVNVSTLKKFYKRDEDTMIPVQAEPEMEFILAIAIQKIPAAVEEAAASKRPLPTLQGPFGKDAPEPEDETLNREGRRGVAPRNEIAVSTSSRCHNQQAHFSRLQQLKGKQFWGNDDCNKAKRKYTKKHWEQDGERARTRAQTRLIGPDNLEESVTNDERENWQLENLFE